MSRSSVVLSGRQRILTEKVTQTQTVNGQASQTVNVEVQAMNPLSVGVQPQPLAKYAANGASSIEMNTSADVFEIAPGADEIYRLNRLTLVLVCAGTPGMTLFGDLAALTNGVQLEVRSTEGAGSQLYDLLDGQPLKSLNDMAAVGEVTIGGNSVIFDFEMRAPIRLEDADSEILRCTTQDSLAGLTRMRLSAIGVVESSLS